MRCLTSRHAVPPSLFCAELMKTLTRSDGMLLVQAGMVQHLISIYRTTEGVVPALLQYVFAQRGEEEEKRN